MTDRAALKLSFTPDDYLVTWQLPSPNGSTISVHGSLTVEAGMPPKGTAHGSFDTHLKQMAAGVIGFPQSVDVPTVTGNLSSGANVLLINARVLYWHLGQAKIDAETAIITLADLASPDDALFRSFEIQVGGLDAIAGVGPIKSTQFPKEGAAGTWAAELAADFKQEWSDADASVSLTYYGSIRAFDPYAFRMGFSPVVSCDLVEPIPLRHLLDDWVEPLRRFVSIATGRAEELTYLAVYSTPKHRQGQKSQVFGTGITQMPYESSREVIEKIDAPLRLKPDGVSLLELLRTWQKLASMHHPLLETYGSMLHARDEHPRSRFLLLLQAIEGTHGYETKESFAKRQKKHTEDRDAVIERAKEILDTKQLKFLEGALSKRPPGGLESAINWLAKKLPGDAKAQLEATSLVTAVEGAPTNARNAPDALRIIRNDLAHGTKGYDAYELQQVVKVLEQVVRAHALEILGCPSGVITRALGAS